MSGTCGDTKRLSDTRIAVGSLVLGLVIAGQAVGVFGAPQAPTSAYVTVDPMRKLIVIAPSVPSDFKVCDGPRGACVPLQNLREASLALTLRGGAR